LAKQIEQVAYVMELLQLAERKLHFVSLFDRSDQIDVRKGVPIGNRLGMNDDRGEGSIRPEWFGSDCLREPKAFVESRIALDRWAPLGWSRQELWFHRGCIF
jgi:hypothetical protein